jgi:hypothetical protein
MKPAILLASLAFIATPLWDAVAQKAELGMGPAVSFEGILTQTEGAIDGQVGEGRGAVHRGAVTLTITRRGSVSGRIRYNEILLNEGAGSPIYRPVVRAFSGALKPVGEASGHYALSVGLGGGAAAGRQRLVLEADYSGARATVVARVIDGVSANADGGKGLLSQTPALAATGGGPLPEGVPGRYVLNTEGAYVLLQFLPTGKLLWSTRMPRYANTGSALAVRDASGFTCAFYEAKNARVGAGSEVNSLLGTIGFLQPETDSSTWQARAGDVFFPEGLDWQSSMSPNLPGSVLQLTGTAGGVAPGAAAAAAPETERELLYFAPEDSGRWIPKEATSGITPVGGDGSAPAVLVVRNVALSSGSGVQVLYRWNVFSSGAGFRAEGVLTNGVLPPALSLRLARDRGEFTGSYVDASARRRGLKGAAVSSSSGFSAEGWVEPVESGGAAVLVWELRSAAALASPAAELAAAAPPASAAAAVAPCPCGVQGQSAGALPATTAAAAAADIVSGGSVTTTVVNDCVPPLIDPPPLILPPPLIQTPLLIPPPPLINPPPLIDPPALIPPPPLIDPPPLIAPPPLIEPPLLIDPPLLILPPQLIQPPGLIAPPDLIAPPPLC